MPLSVACKYLGVLQHEEIQHKESKLALEQEFFKRTKLLLKSALYSRFLVRVINEYVAPVLHYSGEVLNWTVMEL